LVVYAFAAVVAISALYLSVNVLDYVGLLRSMGAMEFSIAGMTHAVEDDTVTITLTFKALNPTPYTRLKLSSIQCQLYLEADGGEVYIGATAYAPPRDAALDPDEEYLVDASLEFPRGRSDVFSDEPPDELGWRVRCVLNLSTPLREYFQTYNLRHTSSYVG
jgi:hypothetical protein